MKTIICTSLVLIMLSASSFDVLAGCKLHMPTNGYWVVESTAENSASAFYYDRQNNVIYSEPIRLRTKQFLNNRLKRKLNKRLRSLLMINEALESS